MKTTAEYRRERIAQLESELEQLRAEEAAFMGIDREALKAECKRMKLYGRTIEAAKLYRARLGCGLREAYDAITAL